MVMRVTGGRMYGYDVVSSGYARPTRVLVEGPTLRLEPGHFMTVGTALI